jgi:hypothetical protein
VQRHRDLIYAEPRLMKDIDRATSRLRHWSVLACDAEKFLMFPILFRRRPGDVIPDVVQLVAVEMRGVRIRMRRRPMKRFGDESMECAVDRYAIHVKMNLDVAVPLYLDGLQDRRFAWKIRAATAHK